MDSITEDQAYQTAQAAAEDAAIEHSRHNDDEDSPAGRAALASYIAACEALAAVIDAHTARQIAEAVAEATAGR